MTLLFMVLYGVVCAVQDRMRVGLKVISDSVSELHKIAHDHSLRFQGGLVMTSSLEIHRGKLDSACHRMMHHDCVLIE